MATTMAVHRVLRGRDVAVAAAVIRIGERRMGPVSQDGKRAHVARHPDAAT
jgi:hypothetical protein